MKKSICLLFFATLLGGTLFSQTGITSFNATGGAYSTTYLSDYQCLGINPANLGWTRNNQKINLGLLEFSGFVYSEPLKRSQLVNDLLDSDLKLTLEQKIQAARDFTDSRFFGAA
jgi:hypothetical protein